MKQKKTARLGLRVTPMEKTFWTIRAKEEGYPSLAAWITATLNEKIKLENKRDIGFPRDYHFCYKNRGHSGDCQYEPRRRNHEQEAHKT